jgi:RecJ-like exonuclease
MRSSHLIVILLLGLVYWGHQHYSEKIAAAERTASELRMELEKKQTAQASEPASGQRPTPENSKRNYTCPRCAGEGRVSQEAASSLMGKSSVGTGQGLVSYSTCPTCAGQGYRALYIPDKNKLCSDCGGMGRVIREGATTRHAIGIVCGRCTGRGYVKSQ